MTDAVRQRAKDLFAQHRARARFEPFAGAQALTGLDEAYAVQEAYVALRCAYEGTRIAGWKIGLTSPRMQALLGIDSPIAGAVLAPRLLDSGAAIARRDYVHLGLETEIAVRLGADLPAAGAPYTRAEVAAAVSAVCAAIEIVDDRAADYALTDIGSLVADNSWNEGVVLGAFHDDWPDLAAVTGRVLRDGVEIDRGRGADVLGHPFEPLTWLANHLAARGGGLQAGDVVSTGSIATTRFPVEPEECRFVVDGIGEVVLAVR
jgi:2-keto-4-pentenoate hydratase